MVRHVVEIVVVALVLTVGSHHRGRGGSSIYIDRELRTDEEIEPSPLASHEQGDIDIDHVRDVFGLIHMEVHIKEIALCINHRDRLVVILHTISVQLIHPLRTDGEKEVIMIEPVVYTEIGIHTRRRGVSGNRMQQRRVSRVGMKRHEMVGLRRERGMRLRPHAQERQKYYEYYLFHYYLLQINRFGRQNYKKIPTYTSFLLLFCHFFFFLLYFLYKK